MGLYLNLWELLSHGFPGYPHYPSCTMLMLNLSFRDARNTSHLCWWLRDGSFNRLYHHDHWNILKLHIKNILKPYETIWNHGSPVLPVAPSLKPPALGDVSLGSSRSLCSSGTCPRCAARCRAEAPLESWRPVV